MPITVPNVDPFAPYSAPFVDSPVFILPWLFTWPSCPYSNVAFDRL